MPLFPLLERILFLILHVSGSETFPKPLRKKEEAECFAQLKSGNPAQAKAARDRLIEHNLRLVAHIIKKYYALPFEQNDLISIGTIGLIKAIDSFDPDKGIRLSSYASRCVENEILMYFRSIRKTMQDVSLSDPIDIDREGNPMSLLDTLTVEEDMAENLDQKEQWKIAQEIIRTELTERERTILILRYGLVPGRKPLAQREVAKKLGISRSYVSRIEKKALQTIQKGFKLSEE